MEESILGNLTVEDREEVLIALMDDYGQDVMRLSFSYVKNHAVAEELTQEIFIKVYEKLDTYKRKSSLKTWLWRIAINHCKDYLKSWHYRKVLLAEKISLEKRGTSESTEDEVIQRNEDALLAEEVLHLPVKYREVIHLHYFMDMSIREIEQVIGINQNTIKTRLKRAKELLKDRLEEEF